MTKDSVVQLIEQCKANEANLLAQIHKSVGAREALEHVLNEMNKPSEKPKAKRGRKKVVDESTAAKFEAATQQSANGRDEYAKQQVT